MAASIATLRYAVNVTERDFQKRIETTATMFGWSFMHISESTKRVRRGGKYLSVPDPACQGWPDLTLAHPRSGRLLFREVKTDKGKLTPEQEQWLRTLAACGQDVAVWRPRDWANIVNELTERGGDVL
jgi:hypothetical protein